MKCPNVGPRARLAAAALAASCLGAPAAQATETGVPTYPPGVAKFDTAAFPRYPGLYLQFQSSYSSANRLNDTNGDQLPFDFRSRVAAEAIRFIYVYEGQIAGATAVSQVITPFLSLDVELDTGGFGFDERRLSLGDVTVSPLILDWKLDERNYISLGLDLVLPTGSYSTSRNVNVGKNYFAAQPVVGYKYVDPNGLEAGALARLSFNGENPDTDYKSGTEFTIDYAVGWNMGQWKPGLVGFYYKQIADDKRAGVTVGDGNRGESFGIGPSVTYTFPDHSFLRASVIAETSAKNKSQGASLSVDYAFKF